MIPSESNAWAGQNSCGYKNPEVDKLIDDLETELSAAKRKAIAHKILHHYTKDVPVIPIYYRPNTSVIPKGMKGYQLSGHLFYETLYAENWSL
jgi:peptide/nickel transport system substrate-binding protein